MLLLRCACRHVADGSAPGDAATAGEKNLVLDALLQKEIEVQLDARERAEYIRITKECVKLHNSGAKGCNNVNIIEALRRPLSGETVVVVTLQSSPRPQTYALML